MRVPFQGKLGMYARWGMLAGCFGKNRKPSRMGSVGWAPDEALGSNPAFVTHWHQASVSSPTNGHTW